MKSLIIMLLLAWPLAATAQDKSEDDYNPRWVFHPLNINIGYFNPGYGPLADSLRAAGYGKMSRINELGGIDLEAYHKSHLVFSLTMNFSGNNTDTLINGKGYYNLIREVRHINSALSIGYNIFPLRKAGLLTLYPKVGIYLSRLKVKTTNYAGDTLLLPSVFGTEARENKTIRYWESGIQAGLKVSYTPFWNSNSMLGMFGFGLEAGLQYNTRMLLNGRTYDKGHSKATELPAGKDLNSYVRLEFQLLRGVWCVQKKRVERHRIEDAPKLFL